MSEPTEVQIAKFKDWLITEVIRPVEQRERERYKARLAAAEKLVEKWRYIDMPAFQQAADELEEALKEGV